MELASLNPVVEAWLLTGRGESEEKRGVINEDLGREGRWVDPGTQEAGGVWGRCQLGEEARLLVRRVGAGVATVNECELQDQEQVFEVSYLTAFRCEGGNEASA